MDELDARQAAVQRIEKRREFQTHLVVYLAVNALLIAIWAGSGAGYFWPIWPIAGWGFAVAMHWWSLRERRSITEEEIRAEMRREGPPPT